MNLKVNLPILLMCALLQIHLITETSSSETILDTRQGTSKNETTTNDNSEMEVQEGEANTSLQKTNTNIMAGTTAICLNGFVSF